MTDWHLVITGLLGIIAILVACCAYGVYVLIAIHRVNAVSPLEDDGYPLSRYDVENWR